ncbi:MAG: hypothetical protein ABFE07_06185 [Armatimonadia bacterium]
MADKEEGGVEDFLSLSALKRRLDSYVSLKRAERDEDEEATRYYHGDQWTPDEIQKLKARNQPIVTFNHVQPYINSVIGLLERLRQDPKAYPRTPKHQDRADVATACINYVLDENRWKDISPLVARDGAVRFAAGVEMSFEGDEANPDVVLSPVDMDYFFYDARSSREDFSDCRGMGMDKWFDLDEAITMFPDMEDQLEEIGDTGGPSLLTNSERAWVWTSANERKVRIVEHWYIRRGEWRYCYYTGSMKLREGVSPFVDDKGKTMCRFIMFSSAVDHAGDRYGLVRNVKSPQDEINHRRSKGLHGLNTIRVYVESGTVPDLETLRGEIHKNDGVIELPPGAKIDERSNAEQVAGNLEMYTDAKAEFERLGLQQILTGSADNQSGRAIQLLQQAATAELGPFIIAYRGWKMRVYRAVWFALKAAWTGEKWIRVTDDEGIAQFLPINQMQPDPMTGMMRQVNPIGEVDVDIIIDEGPDTITLMQDVFATLESMVSKGIPIPPDVIIEMAGLPTAMKDKILERMKQMQAPDPMQQQAAEIQLAGEAAKVKETEANAALKVAQAQAAMRPEAPGAMPEGPNPAETMETLARVDETKANTILKLVQAEKTRVETELAPQQMAQKAEADRARLASMNNRPAGAQR